VNGGVPVKALLMNENRNTEATLFHEEALDSVRQLCLFAWGPAACGIMAAAAGVTQTPDLTKAMAVTKRSVCFG
jgi:hypothetical protein